MVSASPRERQCDSGRRYHVRPPEYARTVGLALRSGRDIGRRDVEGSEPVALVNESLAQYLWPGRSALGQRFSSCRCEGMWRLSASCATAGTAGSERPRYLPSTCTLAQHRGLATAGGAIIARASRDAGPLVPLVEQEVRAFDPDLLVSETSTIGGRLAGLAMPQRMGASLLGTLGGLARALAVIGVYGSVPYAVTSRTREIGVRIALGASTPAIVGTVLSGTLLYSGVGIATGVVAAFALTRFVEQFLFEVAPHDPVTFMVVTAAILLATLLAGLAPALRAARIAPAVALAEE